MPHATIRTDLLQAGPAGSRADELRRLRELARLLDAAYQIPGTNWRIGWDSLIGLVPVVGDVVAGGVSAAIILRAAQLGAPKWVLLRMAANVAVDLAVGAIPVVGDVFDVAWKANRRNIEILERHFERQERKAARQAKRTRPPRTRAEADYENVDRR